MKPKNCLIFGASGQIGRHLIRKLTENNYKVTAVTRNVHQKGYVLKTQGNAGYIDIVELNIFNENKLKDLISRADICINLIGILYEKNKGNTFENADNLADSALAMLKEYPVDFGIEITMKKGFSPGSGLGSSAASSGGSAFGVNQLLNKPFSNLELTKFAMLGEKIACGTPIADNVAAVIFGGFILIRSYEPLDVIKPVSYTHLTLPTKA